LLLASFSASEEARLAARITGAPRNASYKLALERANKNRGKVAPVTPR